MSLLKFAIALLACASTSLAISCPDGSEMYYHADVSTGCQVYIVCENSELLTVTCPSGQAFDYNTLQCQNSSEVYCYESLHLIHKRSVDEVHTVSLEVAKSTAISLYWKIRPIVAEAIKMLSPSIYSTIQSDFLPTVYAIRNDVMPLVMEKLWPQAQKLFVYGRRMGARLFEKVYRSYQLSNSTHLSFVSVSDIVQDVNKDLQPVLKLGRYFASRLMQPARSKRDVVRSERVVADIITGYVEPMINLYRSVGNTECQDALGVQCSEIVHHIEKRSLEEVYTISLEEAKFTAINLYQKLTPIIAEAVKFVSPTIYSTIQFEYLPIVYAIRDDVMPIFMEKLWPQAQKCIAYGIRMGARVFEKVYRGYQLSNSTHISFVSVSDIVQDVNKDLQPILKLGRYFASRLMPSARSKREVVGRPRRELPEYIMGFVEPVLKDLFSTIGNTLLGNHNSLTSKVLLPTLFELLDDPETRFDLKRLMWASQAAISPVIWEMLDRQTFQTPEGTTIRLPRQLVNKAIFKLGQDVMPIIMKLAFKHFPMILRRASENVPLIFQTLDRLMEAKRPHAGVLKDNILKFVAKHGAVLKSSDPRYYNSYTLSEIKNDLTPIKVTLIQVLLEYLSRSKSSWVKVFFNNNSFLYRSILGNAPIYASPKAQVGNQRISEHARRIFG